MSLDSPSILFVIALRNVLNLLAMLFFRLNLALIFSNKPSFFKLTDLELQDQLPYEADYSRVNESSIRIFFSRTTPSMQSSSFSSEQRVATIFQMNDMISVFILALIKTVPFNNHR